MKTLQATFFLVAFVPLVKAAPPIQQDSPRFYEYADIAVGSSLQEDYDMLSKDIKKDGTNVSLDTGLRLQADDRELGARPTKDTNLPTCLLCVCLSGSVYCEEIDIEAVPPLPKETAYLYARFNKIKRIAVSDFADITTLRRIDFSGNMIEEIEDGAFSKLLLLEELSLAENRLVKLPVLPPKLTTFNANQNRIKSRGIKNNAFKRDGRSKMDGSDRGLWITEMPTNNNIFKVLPDFITSTLTWKFPKHKRLFYEFLDKTGFNIHNKRMFPKLTNLAYLYLGHNALESVPLNLPESLRILHLQHNNITTITDDTFCKSNNTRYVRTRMDEIRMEGNPILLAKHVNAFSCLRTLPVGTYY